MTLKEATIVASSGQYEIRGETLETEDTNYHHIIPRSLSNRFPAKYRNIINMFQVEVPVEVHRLLEAYLVPLLHLAVHGEPETDAEFQTLLAILSGVAQDKFIKPHLRTRIRLRVVCSGCGCVVRVKISSLEQVICRECGTEIWNPEKELKYLYGRTLK